MLGALPYKGILTISPSPTYIKDAYEQGWYVGNAFVYDGTETPPCSRGILITLTDYKRFGLQIIYSYTDAQGGQERKIYWRLAWGDFKSYNSTWSSINNV